MAGGHIGPSPSSRYAAPPLRFGRYAMTAPFRCGKVHPWSLLSEAGRKAGPLNKDHGGQEPEPRGGVNVCE
jgi:hypothetical protein